MRCVLCERTISSRFRWKKGRVRYKQHHFSLSSPSAIISQPALKSLCVKVTKLGSSHPITSPAFIRGQPDYVSLVGVEVIKFILMIMPPIYSSACRTRCAWSSSPIRALGLLLSKWGRRWETNCAEIDHSSARGCQPLLAFSMQTDYWHQINMIYSSSHGFRVYVHKSVHSYK